jgi:hypothetical protein
MKKLLQDSINEAWSLVPKILIDKFHSIDDYLEIKLIDENPDLFPLIKDMIENNNFIAESTISNNIHNPNNKNLTNIESLHIYDISVANDYFFSGLTNKINEIHINETISMNEINASQRLREAANYKADADKILQVKAAEAEAESKYLAGVGVSKQRKAIVDGMRDSVQGFGSIGSQDVMDLLLITQYFDMIRDMGQKAKLPTTLFLPHGPDSVGHLREELKNQFASNKKK